eukprot:1143078-Pelagomonas_calceolata.AAC.3
MDCGCIHIQSPRLEPRTLLACVAGPFSHVLPAPFHGVIVAGSNWACDRGAAMRPFLHARAKWHA